MKIDVAFFPEKVSSKKNVIIVVDVLLATSALVKMFEKGTEFVIPVKTKNEAFKIAQKINPPLLLAGEEKGLPIPGFDLNTCLIELEKANLEGVKIVLSTSNGTKALKSLEMAPVILTGSLLNARSCAEWAFFEGEAPQNGVTIVCSGQNGDFALCDSVCAGYIIKEFLNLGDFELTDSAHAALALADFYQDPLIAFKRSWTGRRLSSLGHDDDLHYCAQRNISSIVISFENGILKRKK
ncbi:MAG: 2-phosphosulfolactate phosphatase [Caldiserica bacterium]|jgi:2-phosphosulfolactate phosphatase|nr:2-phosphosulfolactate phosphatase [Caldisericota bacterium]MDH7563243.1 2-phosphosulfolactate phosphatase [Caldisericota bacterium]